MIFMECQEVGETLRRLKNVIMDHWETAVRNSIAQSEKEHSIIVRDHVQEILENLILFLKREELDEVELGKAHGNHRAILTNFSLQDILKEYSILRETLIYYLYPMADIGCARIVHKYIDIVAKNSVVEFLNETYEKRVRRTEVGSEIKELQHDLGQSIKSDLMDRQQPSI